MVERNRPTAAPCTALTYEAGLRLGLVAWQSLHGMFRESRVQVPISRQDNFRRVHERISCQPARKMSSGAEFNWRERKENARASGGA
jgi:hypothetical protein